MKNSTFKAVDSFIHGAVAWAYLILAANLYLFPFYETDTVKYFFTIPKNQDIGFFTPLSISIGFTICLVLTVKYEEKAVKIIAEKAKGASFEKLLFCIFFVLNCTVFPLVCLAGIVIKSL